MRDSESDIFYRVRARHRRATALGRRRILVFLARSRVVADCILRSATADSWLRFRTRTYPRALGLVDGRTVQPVPREPRRRTHRNEPHEFFHRARALFFSALQHSRPRRLRIAQSFLQRATLRAIALRRRWRDLVVSFHVHLLA